MCKPHDGPSYSSQLFAGMLRVHGYILRLCMACASSHRGEAPGSIGPLLFKAPLTVGLKPQRLQTTTRLAPWRVLFARFRRCCIRIDIDLAIGIGCYCSDHQPTLPQTSLLVAGDQINLRRLNWESPNCQITSTLSLEALSSSQLLLSQRHKPRWPSHLRGSSSRTTWEGAILRLRSTLRFDTRYHHQRERNLILCDIRRLCERRHSTLLLPPHS